MDKCKSKTSVGKGLESSTNSFAEDIKAATKQIAFIRNGLTEGHHIAGAMDCLHQVQEKLEDLAEDLVDKIKDIIALDALAVGQGLFVPQGRHEEEAIEALRRAQETDAARDARFDPSLSRAISKTIIRAEQAFRERFQNPTTEDDSVAAAVVEAAGADQTPEETPS